jgi:EpsI family protein
MAWGVKAAEGFFHSFSGWIVFMVCFGCFLLINKLLSYLPGKIRPKQSSKYETASQEHSPASLSLAPMLVCILLIVAMPYAVGHFGSVPPVPLKRPLTEFPLTLESMQGRRTEMDPQIWEQVGGQQYIMVDYFSEGKTPVHFYTAYYEQQKKSGDFIHSPKLCLPGAGWHIQINRTRAIALDNPNERHLEKLRFNELITQKNDHRQLVYFWYQGRDRNFTSEWAAKFYMVWDGIWHRRTDGALVRLIMNLRPNQAIADGRLVLDRFALAVAQELQNYLP